MYVGSIKNLSPTIKPLFILVLVLEKLYSLQTGPNCLHCLVLLGSSMQDHKFFHKNPGVTVVLIVYYQGIIRVLFLIH